MESSIQRYLDQDGNPVSFYVTFDGAKEGSFNRILRALMPTDSTPIIIRRSKNSEQQTQVAQAYNFHRRYAQYGVCPALAYNGILIDQQTSECAIVLYYMGEHLATRDSWNVLMENPRLRLSFIPKFGSKLVLIHKQADAIRDLKPKNVLFNPLDNDFYAIDPGEIMPEERYGKAIYGTLGFIPFHRLTQHPTCPQEELLLSQKVDYFAFFAIVYYLVTGRFLLNDPKNYADARSMTSNLSIQQLLREMSRVKDFSDDFKLILAECIVKTNLGTVDSLDEFQFYYERLCDLAGLHY